MPGMRMRLLAGNLGNCGDVACCDSFINYLGGMYPSTCSAAPEQVCIPYNGNHCVSHNG